jgi:hypothetical protein
LSGCSSSTLLNPVQLTSRQVLALVVTLCVFVAGFLVCVESSANHLSLASTESSWPLEDNAESSEAEGDSITGLSLLCLAPAPFLLPLIGEKLSLVLHEIPKLYSLTFSALERPG